MATVSLQAWVALIWLLIAFWAATFLPSAKKFSINHPGWFGAFDYHLRLRKN